MYVQMVPLYRGYWYDSIESAGAEWQPLAHIRLHQIARIAVSFMYLFIYVCMYACMYASVYMSGSNVNSLSAATFNMLFEMSQPTQ